MKPSLAMQFVTGLLSATFAIGLYHMLYVRPALSFAVVDVAAVYKARQSAFADSIVKQPSVDERVRALAAAKVFAARLPVAMNELANECRCLLLDKSVVIGTHGPLPDLTEQLKRKTE